MINENKLITKKIENKCKIVADNYYVKQYYTKINSLIYQKIVETDKRKLLFVNVVPYSTNEEPFFLTKIFNESSLPHINFIQNKNSTFKIDKHWNDFGHKEVSNIIINKIKKDYKIF